MKKILTKKREAEIVAMAQEYDVPGLIEAGFHVVTYYTWGEVVLQGNSDDLGFRLRRDEFTFDTADAYFFKRVAAGVVITVVEDKRQIKGKKR